MTATLASATCGALNSAVARALVARPAIVAGDKPPRYSRTKRHFVRGVHDALLGDDGRYVTCGGHVEGGVRCPHAGWGDGRAAELRHLGGVALLDGDLRPTLQRQVDGGKRCRDVEGDAVGV